MKTLSEIIGAVKDGERPDYEDLRYAVCALDALMFFDLRAIMKMAKGEKEGKKKKLMYSAEWQYKETFNRRKAAMGKPPKEWLGPNHDPNSDDVQERRKFSKKIYDTAINSQKTG